MMRLISWRRHVAFKAGAASFAFYLVIQSMALAEPPATIVAKGEGPAKSLVVEFSDTTPDPEVSSRQSLITRHIREVLSERGFSLNAAETVALWRELESEALDRRPATDIFALDLPAALLISARDAYYRFQFARCLTELDHASRQLHSLPKNFPVSLPIVFGISLLRGICLLADQETVDARASFLEALRLQPEAELDATQFSPQVVEAFQDAKREAGKAQKENGITSVSIQSDPPFVAVYVNGRYAGETPLTVEHELKGNYYLRLSGKGFEDWYSRYEVSSAELVRIKAKLSPRRSGQERDGHALENDVDAPRHGLLLEHPALSPPWVQELGTLARVIRADQLILVGLRSSAPGELLQVIRFDIKSGTVLHQSQQKLLKSDPLSSSKKWVEETLERTGFLAPLNLSAAGRAIEAENPSGARELMGLHSGSVHLRTRSVLQDDETVRSESLTSVLSESRSQKAKTPVYRRWWFWSLIALAVAGIASGTAIAVSSGSDDMSHPGAGPTGNPQGVVVIRR